VRHDGIDAAVGESRSWAAIVVRRILANFDIM
jgi:hypothetical protein